MPQRVYRLENDFRWFVLLMLCLVTTLHQHGDNPWQLFGSKNKAITRLWGEMDLRWQEKGPYGIGVYGTSLYNNHPIAKQLKGSTGDLCLTSPRLAGFVFRQFDLNLIDVDTMQIVRGIGPKLATSIVEYRSLHGLYDSIDGLLAVKGIGPAKLSLLKRQLCVADSAHINRN